MVKTLHFIYRVTTEHVAVMLMFPSRHLPAQNNNRNTRTRYEICSKVATTTPERHHRRLFLVTLF